MEWIWSDSRYVYGYQFFNYQINFSGIISLHIWRSNLFLVLSNFINQFVFGLSQSKVGIDIENWENTNKLTKEG